ncbi:MAG: hypothetical protein WC718_12325 [Phycisphaerales bacterium]
MRTHISKSASVLILAAFSGVLAAPACGQSFELLVGPPDMPGTSVDGLSADGTRAAGTVGNANFSAPYIWSRTGGVQRLTELGVPNGYFGVGISGNGQVVIGANGTNAFRWSQSAGFESLQAPAGYLGAYVISTNNDGSLVAGRVRVDRPRGAPPAYYATRWDAAGTPTLLDPNRNLGDSFVNAVSRDGSTIVGYGNGGGGQQAYKWTQAGGIQVLPNVLGVPGNQNEAFGISANGQFIVGISNDIPVIWHDNTVTALTLPDGISTYAGAAAINDDATVIGGSVRTADTSYVAGVWTPSTQFIPLTDYLASYGVYVPAGITLTNVTAISADGRTFAGSTLGQGGFIATIPTPGAAMLALCCAILPLRRRRHGPVLAVAAGALLATSVASAQSFDLIVGPSDMPFTSVDGLSADGLQAAGTVAAGNFGAPYIWSRSGGVQRLTELGVPARYLGSGISGNGQVVVGGNGTSGFRWSQSGGFQALQAPAGFTGADARSTDNGGSLVGGIVWRDPNNGLPPFDYAARWVASGAVTLLDPNRTLGNSYVNAVSRDGSTLVGYGRGGGLQAFKWTQAGGIQVLPNLLGTSDNYNEACAVSGNGQFIVGISNDRSVLWNGNTITELRTPSLDGRYTNAEAVNDDASVIAGQVFVSASVGLVAGVWTPTTQFIPLTDYLASYGVQVPDGVTLNNVTAISADGRTFAGTTNLSYGFIATVPTPGAAMLALCCAILPLRRWQR